MLKRSTWIVDPDPSLARKVWYL